MAITIGQPIGNQLAVHRQVGLAAAGPPVTQPPERDHPHGRRGVGADHQAPDAEPGGGEGDGDHREGERDGRADDQASLHAERALEQRLGHVGEREQQDPARHAGGHHPGASGCRTSTRSTAPTRAPAATSADRSGASPGTRSPRRRRDGPRGGSDPPGRPPSTKLLTNVVTTLPAAKYPTSVGVSNRASATVWAMEITCPADSATVDAAATAPDPSAQDARRWPRLDSGQWASREPGMGRSRGHASAWRGEPAPGIDARW